jgi:polyisoprenoid-binding protein YceI
MRLFLMSFFMIFFIAQASAASFTLDKDNSSLEFSGTHMGKKFTGTFKTWDADIDFDPIHLNTSQVSVTIDSASAYTGNTVNDATLPQADWLDSKNYPTITFKSTAFEDLGNKLYKVTGDLTIKAVTLPISFEAQLSDPTADIVEAEIHVSIDRTQFNVGTKSDAKGEWVGRDIALHFNLTATKK